MFHTLVVQSEDVVTRNNDDDETSMQSMHVMEPWWPSTKTTGLNCWNGYSLWFLKISVKWIVLTTSSSFSLQTIAFVSHEPETKYLWEPETCKLSNN